MQNALKDFVRKLAVRLPFRLTQNQWYDHCTLKIIQRHMKAGSNCVDVGCHKGEMMDVFLKYCPKGIHIGIEPLPSYYRDLQKKYAAHSVILHNFAVSDKYEETNFTFVPEFPAYSGLKPRNYEGVDAETRHLSVRCSTLDLLIPEHIAVDLIKIDVEGGELGVFRGSQKVLEKYKPLLIFEHGMGAADHYGTTPEMVHGFLNDQSYDVYLLDDFLARRPALDLEQFKKQFYQKLNYYFVAKSRSV